MLTDFNLLWFVIGMFTGAHVGLLVLALCHAAGQNSPEIEGESHAE